MNKHVRDLLEIDADGWRSFNGGRRWRILDDGRIEVERAGNVPRTRGEPKTMGAFLDAHAIVMRHWACEYQHVTIAHLMAMAGIEIGAFKVRRLVKPGATQKSWYVQTDRERWEEYTRARPDGQYSMGPWQMLETTASNVNKRHKLLGKGRVIATDDLEQPEIACGLTAAHMSDIIVDDHNGDADIVILSAAWNAGSARPMDVTSDRPWGLRTYGNDRIGNTIKWWNDSLAVLEKRGVEWRL